MRPPLLNPLFSSVSSLPGIGPKLEKNLTKLFHGQQPGANARLVDLIFHLPHSIIDRRHQPKIRDAQEGAIVTMKVWIDKHNPPPRGNKRIPYRVLVHDESSFMTLVFFHAHQQWIEKVLPVGEPRYISGKMEWFNDQPSMVHPDHIVDETEFAEMPLVEPVYGLTSGLSAKVLKRSILSALESLPELPDWLDDELKEKQDWPNFVTAIHQSHHPRDPADLSALSPARRRLAMDEYLSGQIALTLMRARMKRLTGASRIPTGRISDKIIQSLPYSLTGAQRRSVEEINQDLAKPERMLRLLQGDVGSGKTIVALLAMVTAIENGGQAAIMAPTEILARQHYETLLPLCDAAGIRLGILSGKSKSAEKKRVNQALVEGDLDIIVGTHALFQEAVEFNNLAIAIIDEQHRFGVHQRLALSEKGNAVDILIMTATPIPRTLVLSYFGDMDVSRLDEKPAGRQPITTNAMALERLEELIDRVAAIVQAGEKVYWICPLVEESDELPITSAVDRQAALMRRMGDQVGLVHGRMSSQEKDDAMQSFKQGETKVLVATTVIEVGVDVPDATIMIIEHAERFGLAQLHQLRGRVGRSSRKSSCILLYKSPLGETAKARINVMRESEDGFRIAEEDLKLRGEGEILGTRQSGMPGFNLANPEFHGDVLEMARDYARLLVHQDPELTTPKGEAVRILLYLFGQDQAIRLLRAG